MEIIGIILTHLFVFFGLGSMVYFMFHLIMEDANINERGKRIASLIIGLMIYVLAKFSGQDYVTTLFSSYIDVTSGWITQIIKLFVPALIGYFVSLFFYKKLTEKDEKQKKYILIVVYTLIFFVFVDIYFGSHWTDIKKSNIIANASFVLGILVMFVFGKYDIQDIMPDRLGLSEKKSKNTSGDNNTHIPSLKE